MPSRTLEDRVEELTKLTAAHDQKLVSLGESLGGVVVEHSRTSGSLQDLARTVVRVEQLVAELHRWKAESGSLSDLKVDLAVLRREVDKLERAKEEWGRRLWALAGPILGAAVGWALGYFSRP